MIFLLPVISALLLVFAFPPFEWANLVWVGFVPLLFFVKWCPLKKGNFRFLFIFGLFFFGGHLFWLTVLKEWAGPVAYLGWLGLVLYLNLFYAAALFLTHVFYRKLRAGFFCLAVPAVWTLVEWLRSIGPFGVTLGNFSLPLYKNLTLLKIAGVAGIFGLNFLIVLINVLIFLFLDKKNSWRTAILTGLILGAGFWLLTLNDLNPNKSVFWLKVAAIQPNIPQKDKLNPLKTDQIFEKHFQQTEILLRQAKKVDLIVWPESLSVIIDENHAYFKKIVELARTNQTALLVGAFTENAKPNPALYNSALLFSGEGKLIDVYKKHQLVPFGEYLPLKFIFYPFLRTTGFFEQDQKAGPLKTMNEKLGVEICFESNFPQISRSLKRLGAQVFLVMTNDAWFLNTPAAFEHFMFLAFRARETGSYFLQVANTGISGLVGPNGQIIFKTRLNTQENFVVQLPLEEKNTFYVKYGDWLIWLCWVMVGLGIVIVIKKSP